MAPNHDVIIIGGGTAGCVLAARLTEDPNLSVLLLEVGKDHSDHKMVSVPSPGPKLWEDRTVNQNYETVAQENLNGRTIVHPRGKGLGGCTLINHSVMVFPDRHSIDNFGLLGNEGWSFDEMIPYYRRFHTYHEPPVAVREKLAIDYNDPKLHGDSGPVQISYGTHQSEPDSAWGRTLDNLGRKVNADLVSGNAVGGFNAPACLNPDGWTRSHAAQAYLTPEVRARPNLEILTEALVEKLLFAERTAGQDSSPPVVDGVQYVSKDGTRLTVHASGEVVLCGGAFNSPQLLELSGIGSKKILDRFGIETKVDLTGVGANLQDHTIAGASWEATIDTLDVMVRDPAVGGAAFEEYQKHQTGPMSNGTWSLAFLGSELSGAAEREFSALLDESAPGADAYPGQKKQFELLRKAAEDPKRGTSGYIFIAIQGSPEQYSPIPDEAKDANFLSFWAIVSHPFSRGTCHIASADVRDAPEIDPRYMNHPADVEMAARRLQYARTIVATQPLAGLIKPNGVTIPPALDEVLADADRVRRHVRTGTTCYHPCGTCAMMPHADGGVVDPRLRVYGVSRLRVVDASILPMIPRGNIQTTIYAVAERAADMIKDDLRKN